MDDPNDPHASLYDVDDGTYITSSYTSINVENANVFAAGRIHNNNACGLVSIPVMFTVRHSADFSGIIFLLHLPW